MKQYQIEFIEFLINQQALLFGTFTLKSQRISPYFFNAGKFDTSRAISLLGQYYARIIVESDIKYDILFGPAYKGIPIVTSVAIALYENYGIEIPFCFNRKEPKPYGEGGYIIGSPLKGRVLWVDDVISSGTTFHESIQLINNHPAKLAGVVTALDREERGTNSDLSALEEIIAEHDVPVLNIIHLSDIIEYMKDHAANFNNELQSILAYQTQYGKLPKILG